MSNFAETFRLTRQAKSEALDRDAAERAASQRARELEIEQLDHAAQAEVTALAGHIHGLLASLDVIEPSRHSPSVKIRALAQVAKTRGVDLGELIVRLEASFSRL